jgi:predicted DNA-binding transcriptional regulator AlpA
MEMRMSSKLFSTQEAAQYLNIARQTLAAWRVTGKGPSFLKIGRKVSYEVSSLDAFLTSHSFRSTSEY